MNPVEDEDYVARCVARLGVLKMYPGDPIVRAEIGNLLMRMVGTRDQCEWLLRTFIDHIGTWEGPKELRAVFCTRFKPLDGQEEMSMLSGFTAADSETATLTLDEYNQSRLGSDADRKLIEGLKD